MSELWFTTLECTCDPTFRAIEATRRRHADTCLLACRATPPWSSFETTTCRLPHGHDGRHDSGIGATWGSDEIELQCDSYNRGGIRCPRRHGHRGKHGISGVVTWR